VREVLEDVIAYGFKRVLVLSGHVTNAAPLRCALEELRSQHPHLQIAQKHVCESSARVKSIYESDADDWHANMAETALMQHLAPELVHENRIIDDPDRTRELAFSYAVPQTSQAGHTGEPTKATPQIGAELFEMLIDDWTSFVQKALTEQAPLRASATSNSAIPLMQPPICGPPNS
jgi:creatinine amidohydrolase